MSTTNKNKASKPVAAVPYEMDISKATLSRLTANPQQLELIETFADVFERNNLLDTFTDSHDIANYIAALRLFADHLEQEGDLHIKDASMETLVKMAMNNWKAGRAPRQ